MYMESDVWEYAEASAPEALGSGARAFSPLGAWLLQASLGGVIPFHPHDGERPMEDVEAAASALGIQPGLASAVGVWLNDARWAPWVRDWVGSLPPQIATGPIPSQGEANAWVAAGTAGQIASLPVAPSNDAILYAVSALAMLVEWDEPLDVVEPKSRQGWFADLARVLHSRDAGLFKSNDGGLTGITQSVAGPVSVYSVIGPQMPVEEATAIALAQVCSVYDGGWESLWHADVTRIGGGASTESTKRMGWRSRRRAASAPSPAETGDFFTVTDRFGEPPGTTVSAELPCWQIDSETVDLMQLPMSAMPFLVPRLVAQVAGPPPKALVEQALTAKFNQKGFAATAVTTMKMGLTSAPPQQTTHRYIDIHYTRPYTVVVVWRNLPVFVIRVTDVVEPD